MMMMMMMSSHSEPSMKTHYIVTNYNNITGFFSLGYIYPPVVGRKHFKYYHLPNQPTTETLIYNKIPRNFDSDAVVIQLENFSDRKLFNLNKRNLKKIQSDKNASATEKYIPVTSIEKIFVKSNEIIEKLKQMEFSDIIDYPDNLFEVNGPLFIKDETTESELNSTSLLTKSKSKKKHKASDDYNHFENMVTFNLLIMNYVFEKNLYCMEIDTALPKSFKPYHLQDERECKFIKCLKTVGEIFFDENINSKEASVTINDFLKESEKEIKPEAFFLWMAIIRKLMNSPGLYRVEERDDLYIDNNRQYRFTKDSLFDIGKKYSSFHKKYFTRMDQPLSDDDYKDKFRSDSVLPFLTQLHENYDNLDFKSQEILDSIQNSDDMLFQSLGVFVHDLIRYGDDISIFLQKFNSLNCSGSKLDLLTGIVYANFIGLPMLPKKIKQCDNSKFLWSSIDSDQILFRHKIRKTLRPWDAVAKWVSDFINVDEDDRYIRLNSVRYEIIFDRIEISEDVSENEINAVFPLKNDFGFLFYHSEQVSINMLEDKDSTIFNRYMKKHHEQEFKKYIFDFQNKLPLIEKMKFHLYNNRRSN